MVSIVGPQFRFPIWCLFLPVRCKQFVYFPLNCTHPSNSSKLVFLKSSPVILGATHSGEPLSVDAISKSDSKFFLQEVMC